MSAFRAVGFLASLALLCPAAWAQVSAGSDQQRLQQFQQLQQYNLGTRLSANQDIPLEQRTLIDYGGYFLPQYYSIDDSSNNNHGLWQFDLFGYLRLNFDGANEIFLRGKLEYNDYNPGDSFDGLGSRVINPDFDRAFYKFDLARYESAYNGKVLNGDIEFEGGRDLVYWGNGLVLGEVLDGVMPVFSLGNATLTTVAGVTPVRTVDIQPDRPDFDHNTRRGFYGGIFSLNIGSHRPYIYGLGQVDYNGHNFSQIGPIATRYSYNSNYLGIGSTGSLSDHVHYGFEAAYENGNGLSDSSVVEGFTLVPVPQTRDNIQAYGGNIKLDYVPQDAHNSRLTLEGTAASGDSDRGLTNTTFNGNQPGSNDRAFNAFGLLSSGLAFGAPISNLTLIRAGFSTFPLNAQSATRRLQIGSDLYFFAKTNANAPIDEPTAAGRRYLGWEPDFYLNWDMASDVTLAVRYGAFFPSASAFTNSQVRQFFYAGVTFAF